MQSKWRAPACYIGVAALCALYLAIVPGVTLTDVAAGAGIGAALMWAINEWETGKWGVKIAFQPVVAAPQAVAAQQAQVQPAMPTEAAQPVAQPSAHAEPAPAVARETAPEAKRSSPPPATSESWQIDDAEPSWDPSALAETWAKLRRELSINPSSSRAAPPAPDLPRTAQLAKGSQLAKAQLPGLAARSAGGTTAPKPGADARPVNGARSSAPAPQPASNLRKPAAEPPSRLSQTPPPSFLRAGAMRPR